MIKTKIKNIIENKYKIFLKKLYTSCAFGISISIYLEIILIYY